MSEKYLKAPFQLKPQNQYAYIQRLWSETHTE